MREQIEKRLTELRGEYEEGQRMLADLQARQNSLHETLLRIAGAIMVMEEMIQEAGPLAEGGEESGGGESPGG
jgi:predicted nuclease with TOPRIM domain